MPVGQEEKDLAGLVGPLRQDRMPDDERPGQVGRRAGCPLFDQVGIRPVLRLAEGPVLHASAPRMQPLPRHLCTKDRAGVNVHGNVRPVPVAHYNVATFLTQIHIAVHTAC